MHILYLALSQKGSRSMVRKYFAGANTASGYVDLLEKNIYDVDKIYTLSGESKKQKTEIMAEVLKKAEEKHNNMECIISPFNIKDISGIIFRDTKTAILDYDIYTGEKKTDNIDIDIGKRKENTVIAELSQKEQASLDKLYDAYEKGKIIHDEWEKIYHGNMDFVRLEAYGKGIIDELIKKKSDNAGTQKYERFFGASTPDGSVNYIDNLTENLSARYFIKGRPGTGKSTFLKKLAKKAQENGYDTEIYYCSFDKNSLDMVIVPELSFCVFDSTAPHEMFPETQRDNILDFYEESGLLGVDEKCENELLDVSKRYKQKVAEGMAYLRLAKLYYKEKEYYFEKNRNEKRISLIKEKLISELL